MNQPLPQRIAVLYSDAKREYFPTEKQYITEVETLERAQIIAAYLNKLGIHADLFPGNDLLTENLKKFRPDFVINLIGSIYGNESLEAVIPATLELLRIPYTGSGMSGLTINSNKYLTKSLLEQYGLTTPKYQLIKESSDEIDPSLDYPLIVKLNEIHGSVEMDSSSICFDEKNLKKKISFLMDTYHQPILIEEYIAGREVSVFILQGSNTKVYSAEKIFDRKKVGKFSICSFDSVWGDEHFYHFKKYNLPEPVKENLKTAFEILKMEDYAKFDLRVDKSGRHYIIDCNANPSIGPKEGGYGFGTTLDLYNISFEDVLLRLIQNTLSDQENEHETTTLSRQ